MPVDTNSIPMSQATPQTALQQGFMQTPGYQLQYGNNTSMDPNQRFQNDPGVQMAVQQGMIPLQQSMAARGLSNSGALSEALSNYMYNNYNAYTQGQGSLFNNYQNQLSGLVNQGTANNGSANAMTTGQNMANANLQTGSNISGLLANQGVMGSSSYLNTGAATANNLFNGMTLLAQLNANTNASQNGQNASLAGGQGAMAGATGSGGRLF